MAAEQPQVADTVNGMVAEKASRYWWVLLVSGIAWLLIAWVVLRMDVRSLTAVGVLIGVVLLIASVNEAAIAQAVTGGWKFVHYGIAAAFALTGIWAFVRPINTFFALASVLGLILVIEGAFEIARAIASREENSLWWLGLITGVLLLLLAFWVSSSDREFPLAARATLILFWVGFMALFRGISQIGMAFGVRHLTRDVRTAARTDGATGSAPPIPAQQSYTPDSAQPSVHRA